MMTSYWVHDLDPFLFRFGGEWGLRYYGLSYALAFIAAYAVFVLLYRKGRSPLNQEEAATLMLTLVAGVMIGGRLGYMLLYQWGAFWANPLLIFKVWQGGMASHGGFVGVIVGCLIYARRNRISFWSLTDLLCLVAPIGFCLGRIANFINGELWGRVATVPWAVIFPRSAPGDTPIELIAARHPSQLYEALLEGVLLGAIVWWRFCGSRAARVPGRLTGEFLLIYAVLRIVGEQFREPDAGLLFGLSRGVFYSLFLLLIGGVVTVCRWRKKASDTI